METGRVIKSYNSFFYVETDDGLLACRIRGKLKRDRRGVGSVCPGDIVEYSRLPDGTGVVERPLERKSLLRRPAVANVDQVVLTFAAAQPDLHPLLFNRFLVLAEWSGIPSIIVCINKMDLAKSREVLSEYGKLYPIIRVSAKEKDGIEELRRCLAGKVTVLAGPSGVGKSSLLNALDSGLKLATGEVSEKILRGRHTTRVAELLPYEGGFIADTPGFSAMELSGLEPVELAGCFPEFLPYLGKCRFSPCTHSHEPDCAIKMAVDDGEIFSERYEAYISILEEISQKSTR